MTVKTPSIISNSDDGRSLNKPTFNITFSGTVETKRRCNIFSLLHYFELAPSRTDENVMSNRSAKIGVHERLATEEWLEVKEILFPTQPYDLKIIPKLKRLDLSPPDQDSRIIQDIGIAKILMNIIAEHHPPVSPQLFVELLNFYNQRIPELLILADPLLRIILLEGNIAHRQTIKTRACAVLINHYEIETLIIYLSCHQVFSWEEKQTLFQSLTAFQKIYRKLLEVHEWIGNKDQISLTWFGKDFGSLKKKKTFRDNFIPIPDELPFLDR